MFGLAAGNHGFDPSFPDEPAVLVVVVAAVGEQLLRPSPGAADAAAHGRHQVEQGEQLRDVVAVAAGQRPGERDPARVDQEVVLGAVAASVDRAGTGLRAPFFACT